MEKLRVNFFKSILYTNIATLTIFVIIYFSVLGTKLWDNFTSSMIIILWFAISLCFSILVPRTFSMSYDNKALYVNKFNKEEVIEFKNVIYIDEPYTEKHKALTFYMKSGKLKFVSFDKEKKILDIFKNNCKNLLTREEFQRMYPTIRL